jgi:hypothetical protein
MLNRNSTINSYMTITQHPPVLAAQPLGNHIEVRKKSALHCLLTHLYIDIILVLQKKLHKLPPAFII